MDAVEEKTVDAAADTATPVCSNYPAVPNCRILKATTFYVTRKTTGET